MLKKLPLIFLPFLVCMHIGAQELESARKSIHEVENEFYSVTKPSDYPVVEKSFAVPSKLFVFRTRELNKKVLGWHPYWISSSAYLSYDYKALSHIAFFSYEVDTATGGYTSIHDWNTTPIIDFAHQRGTKMLLTVTNFGSSRNTELLSDTVKQKFLINTIISLLKSRNGDGVNFDLESVSSSQRINMVDFIARAVAMIKAELPSAEISMATPAVDWSGSFNLKEISQLCDYIIVMGYDYYWSGSSSAGPVAPMGGENYNVVRTVNTYLSAGVAPEKLLLGVPWYGYDWPVVNQTRKAAATGKGTAKTFTTANQLADDNSKILDQTTKVPWVSYSSSSLWRQLWFEDTLSLSMKYNLVNSQNLRGIGIWALSYEGGYKEVWRTINSAFSIPIADKNRIIKIYPNPVSGISRIQFTVANKENVTLKIFDLLGKERIVLVNEELESGFYTKEFNSEHFGPGIYMCVLQTNKTISTSIIIVTK